MTNQLPPIVRLAERLVYECEMAVKQFDRYHKYTLGTEIRHTMMTIWQNTQKAWLYKHEQLYWLEQTIHAIDDSKLYLQLAKKLKCFASVAQFNQIIILITDLGKQCGGWLKASSKSKAGKSK